MTVSVNVSAGDARTSHQSRAEASELKTVVVASSIGTTFQWYDFYLYGSLSAIIGDQFFSAYPESTRNVFTLLAFAAGFVVRPIGALVFGRLGDTIGRKHTFLMTILLMGLSTFFIGCLPTYEEIGTAAPVILVALRILQGLALGGEYGGAAVYVAEFAPPDRRGFYTGFIQTTATLGLLLSLVVITTTQVLVGAWFGDELLANGKKITAFASWGWRIPFLFSVVMLFLSLYARLMLKESPAFTALKRAGATTQAPLTEAFGPAREASLLLAVPLVALVAHGAGLLNGTLAALLGVAFLVHVVSWGWQNARIALIALLGLVAGQAVVWYAGQFYALFFLQSILKVDNFTANTLVAWALLIAAPFFVVFGHVSDRIGRKPVILAGLLLAAILLIPLFKLLVATANPALAAAQKRTIVTVVTDPADCSFQFNPTGTARFTTGCDIAKATLARSSVMTTMIDAPKGTPASVGIGGRSFDPTSKGFAKDIGAALSAAGYPGPDHPDVVRIKVDPRDGMSNLLKVFDIFTAQRLIVLAILTVLVLLVTMVYGPIAAALIDLFPTRIRYSALSLPYHVGNGWFGGLLPATSFAMVAQSGDIYFGLWYPIGVAVLTLVIGAILVPETHTRSKTSR